eukprot:13614995-Alexandrium_andersonii.AAC.1
MQECAALGTCSVAARQCKPLLGAFGHWLKSPKVGDHLRQFQAGSSLLESALCVSRCTLDAARGMGRMPAPAATRG